MTNRTYRERLLATGLDSLELRRLRYDLIFAYKVLSNKSYIDDDGNMIAPRFSALIDIDVDSIFSFNSSFNTRGYVCKLYKTKGAPRLLARTFFARMVNVWNSLPDTVCFSSLAGFSHSLKDTDLSTYLQCLFVSVY